MQECVQFLSACDKHDQQSWQLYVDGLPTYCDSPVGFFPSSHVDDLLFTRHKFQHDRSAGPPFTGLLITW
jgi:hypothetical protein